MSSCSSIGSIIVYSGFRVVSGVIKGGIMDSRIILSIASIFNGSIGRFLRNAIISITVKLFRGFRSSSSSFLISWGDISLPRLLSWAFFIWEFSWYNFYREVLNINWWFSWCCCLCSLWYWLLSRRNFRHRSIYWGNSSCSCDSMLLVLGASIAVVTSNFATCEVFLFNCLFEVKFRFSFCWACNWRIWNYGFCWYSRLMMVVFCRWW